MCQLPGESIDKYITRLKRKAQYCNFADESEMIRDQVIEKCTSHRLRRKLLERADVKLDDVIKLAQTMEFSDKQADAIEQGSSGHSQEKIGDQSHGAAVNRIKAKKATGQSQQKTCWACGRVGHFHGSADCPVKGKKCGTCKKEGHFAQWCRSKTQSRDFIGKRKEKRKYVKQVNDAPNREFR